MAGINDKNLESRVKLLDQAMKSLDSDLEEKERGIVDIANKEEGTKAEYNGREMYRGGASVFRIVDLYLTEYKDMIQKVKYSRSKNVEVKSDKENELTVVVGERFFHNMTSDSLRKKAQQIRKKIIKFLVAKKGNDRIRTIIAKYIDTDTNQDPNGAFTNYTNLLNKMQFRASKNGIEVKLNQDTQKIDIVYGFDFGGILIQQAKDPSEQKEIDLQAVNQLNYALSQAVQPLIKDSEVRQDIEKLLKKYGGWDGKTYRGSAEDSNAFKEILPPSMMQSNRERAAREAVLEKTPDKTWTTCIAFAGRVYSKLNRNKWQEKGQWMGTYKMLKGAPKDAIHKATEKMPKSMRPKKGDGFLLKEKKNGASSHVGVLLNIEVRPDGTEVWNCIDGGQGSGGQYIYTPTPAEKAELQKNKDERTAGFKLGQGSYKENKDKAPGNEKIDLVKRIYDPQTNTMIGDGKNQDSDRRWLEGWVNIDKYFERK